MADVFLSYARPDQERVRPYLSPLQSAGLTVWWDEHIEGGDAWRNEVASNLTEARCVLTFWTTSSLESAFVHDEADRAKKRGVLIQIRLEDVELPLGLGGIQAISMGDWAGDPADKRFAALLRAIRKKVPLAPLAPAIPSNRPSEYPVAVQNDISQIPKWMPVIGVVFSAITLLFLMALVLIPVLTGNTPSPRAKYLVVITLSFCTALSTLGLASMAASGHLPSEVGKDKPIQFTAVGSIAAFIVVFILGNFFYPDDPQAGGAPSVLANVGSPGASDQLKQSEPERQADTSRQARLIIGPDVLTQLTGGEGPSSHPDITYSFYIDGNPTALDSPFEVFTTKPISRALTAGRHVLEIASSRGARATCVIEISQDIREYLITSVPPNGCKAAGVSK